LPEIVVSPVMFLVMCELLGSLTLKVTGVGGEFCCIICTVKEIVGGFALQSTCATILVGQLLEFWALPRSKPRNRTRTKAGDCLKANRIADISPTYDVSLRTVKLFL